ncbi:helix-turn-helix transcriptional regulator [Streptomyces mayteni]
MTLIERRAELEALREIMTHDASGTIRVAAIEGAAGCGKTALLNVAAAEAKSRGAAVLAMSASGKPGLTRCSIGGEWWEFADTPQHSMDVAKAVNGRPLVITLDDAHRTESPQLDFLLRLLHVFESHGVTLLITRLLEHDLRNFAFNSELLRIGRFHRIRVNRLSRDGVVKLIARHRAADGGSPRLGCRGRTTAVAPAAHRRLDAYHAATGGNPLLLRALLEECVPPDTGSAGPAQLDPALRGPFAQAVLACLQRSGADVAEVALGIALLEQDASAGLLGELMGFTPARAAQCTRILEAVGLVEDHRFRHPVARNVVLENVSGQRRAELHESAAVSLHAKGAHPVRIARHIVNAGQVPEDWGAAVLHEAADHASTRNDPRSSIRFLALAAEHSADERVRAAIDVRLAACMWRLNPAAAEQPLLQALNADQVGLLPAAESTLLTRMLLAHGWNVETSGQRGVTQQSVWSSLCEMYDSLCWSAPRPAAPSGPPRRSRPGHVDPVPPWPARADTFPAQGLSSTMWLGPDEGMGDAEAEAAEHGLDITPLSEGTVPLVLNYLKVIAFAGRPRRAVAHGQRLLEEARRRNAPGWGALFLSALAEVALLRGALTEALELGRQTLNAVPDQDGSTFAVAPGLSQVLALVELGRPTDADALLEQTAPPRQVASNMGSMPILRAKGRHQLALGSAFAALEYFTSVGELARRWGVDNPALVPWRLDAAEAQLRIGDRESAARLLKAQHQARDASSRRVRGMTLRLQAALVAPGAARIPVLTQAARELKRFGDSYETARALGDLGAAYEAAGDAATALTVRRRAWHLARECGAWPLCEEILPGATAQTEATGDDEAPPFTRLSDSERRVAVLAAHGLTNREIAGKLSITMSTVEQHLTRIYRKLHIGGRWELRRMTPPRSLPTEG